MAAVSCEQLSKSYGAVKALRGIDLDVPEGGVFGFIGPNGAGKTTTIRILMGMLKASGGRATILGKPCWQASREIKRTTGYLPGDVVLQPWLNGRASARILDLARGGGLVKPFGELADFFDLKMDVRVRNMSRGMRQKLGLIMALVHQPRVLILDEPTTALDPITQDRLKRRLRQMASAGCTIFFSSHVLSEVSDLCDRVAIIRRGEIVADESLATLRGRAKRQVTLKWMAEGTIPEVPKFLELEEQDGRFWSGYLDGKAPQLLQWLQGHPLEDMTFGPPDLDSLFRTYYKDEAVS